jgi:hypothetical protein
MAGAPENLVLVYLRPLDEKVDRVLEGVRDPKLRVTSLDRQVADLRGDMVGISSRIDRIEFRLDRIERRLDLIPPISSAPSHCANGGCWFTQPASLSSAALLCSARD